MEIGTAQPDELRIQVGEEPPLQERIIGNVDPPDQISRMEGHLFSLGKEIVRISVERHLAGQLDEIELLEEWEVNDGSCPGKRDRVNLFGFEHASGTPDTSPGSRAEACAEHITISGLYLDELPSGTRLWVGDMAILEISGAEGAHDLMFKSHPIYNSSTRGLLAHVVKGGMVRKGDQVVILSLGGKSKIQ